MTKRGLDLRELTAPVPVGENIVGSLTEELKISLFPSLPAANLVQVRRQHKVPFLSRFLPTWVTSPT